MTTRYIAVISNRVVGVINQSDYAEVDESVKFRWAPTDHPTVNIGWSLVDGEFTPPAPEPGSDPQTSTYFTMVDKNIFYMLFTPQEEAAIRTIAETNKLVDVLVSRLDKATHVNLTLPSVQQSLALLLATPGTLLTAERVANIMQRRFPTEEELAASEAARQAALAE